jgi:formylglycine-generating enzyme required for sulfatase activity
LDAVVWYGAKNRDTTHPVGEKKPNAFGLYDMHGNVWQWCRDAYSEGYDPFEAADPFNEKGVHRVLRGGAWGNKLEFCRSPARIDVAPDYHWDSIGFRAVLVPRPKAP